MKDLTTAIMRECAILRQIVEEEKHHEKQMKMLGDELRSARNSIQLLKNGVDGGKYDLALSIIQLHTQYVGGEANDVIRRAVVDIANGCKVLKNNYFGTKNYDRWTGQAFTSQYGYDPTHGNIVFSIMLRPEARKRELTEEEKDACIYVLMRLVDDKISPVNVWG